MRLAMFAALSAFSVSCAQASDYQMTLEGKGLREYYCQITVALTNRSTLPLTEISGYFYSYVGDNRVGRSKGAWFLNVGPDGKQQAVFETPNAPCDDVTRYEFVVGACRIGAGFEEVSVCLQKLELQDPLAAARPSG